MKRFFQNNGGLLVVAAVAVLVAVLLLPVLQINGTSMTETLHNEDIVIAVSSSKYETGDVIAFVSKIKNIEPIDAAKFSAETYHIDIDEGNKPGKFDI